MWRLLWSQIQIPSTLCFWLCDWQNFVLKSTHYLFCLTCNLMKTQQARKTSKWNEKVTLGMSGACFDFYSLPSVRKPLWGKEIWWIAHTRTLTTTFRSSQIRKHEHIHSETDMNLHTRTSTNIRRYKESRRHTYTSIYTHIWTYEYTHV